MSGKSQLDRYIPQIVQPYIHASLYIHVDVLIQLSIITSF